ncbi:MAG TPA: response regulator, partial [Hydrogenophaga sp.]|nr:response regulator [Hydrogenophaga sp.]
MTSQLLMIEDDGRLASMVVEYLGQSGFKVTHAADGETGLEQLQILQPELVILDLMMPGMDGLEVCRRIRSMQGDMARVPVIMLTA